MGNPSRADATDQPDVGHRSRQLTGRHPSDSSPAAKGPPDAADGLKLLSPSLLRPRDFTVESTPLPRVRGMELLAVGGRGTRRWNQSKPLHSMLWIGLCCALTSVAVAQDYA